jgi:hypothetical protein
MRRSYHHTTRMIVTSSVELTFQITPTANRLRHARKKIAKIVGAISRHIATTAPPTSNYP